MAPAPAVLTIVGSLGRLMGMVVSCYAGYAAKGEREEENNQR